MAWGEETLYYTLDGTITGGSNGYATESDITQSGITWKITGNTTTDPWRIGGKNLQEVDRSLYSTTPMSGNITKVVVTSGTSNLTVNSMTLYVSSNAEFSNSTQISGTYDKDNPTTFERPAGEDWTNKYFKLVYNVTAGSSNQYVQFVKAEFYAEGGTTPILQTVETPTFSPAAGAVEAGTEVTISSATDGATIYYTTDGTTPSAANGTPGTKVTVNEAMTIKAIAVKADCNDSEVAEATYTVLEPFVIEDGVFNFECMRSDYGSGVTTTSDANEYITEDKTWTAGNVTLVTSGKYRWWENDGTLRFYSNDPASAMTISVPNGKVITSIDITGGQAFSANVGTYDSGKWTGQAQTVTLSYAASSGSVNVKTVTVTYEDGTPVVEKVDIATLNGISPTTLTVGDQGNFSLDATFVEGLTAGEDYEVNWTSDNTEVLGLEGNTYSANAAGTANVTVSVTVLDEDKYNEVSKSFAVTVNEQSGESSTATATFDATKDKASTGSTATEWSITKDGITIEVSNGVGGNGTEYRIYKNQTLTISSVSGNIKKVEFVETTSNPITGFGDIEGFNKDTKTWEGSAESVTFTASTAQVRLAGINVTYEVPTGFVAAPEFSINGGTVVAGTEVTITAEEGNTIVYTTDGTDPSESSTAIGPSEGNVVTITINEAMTIKAIAMDEDANSSEVAEATFDIAKVYESIAALIADKPEKATLRLTDAQVLFVGDNDVYVKDATGALDFFKTGLSYSAGDVLNGTIDVAFTMYNTYTPEVTEVSNNNLTSTSGEVVAETVEANAVTLEKVNYLVSLEGFFNNKSVAGVPVYDKYKVVTDAFGALEDGDYVKVTGIVVNSKGVANIGLTAVEKIDAPTVTVTIKDAGLATFCSDKALDFSQSESVYAYKAVISGTQVNLTKVAKVPAETGVLLRSVSGEPVTADIPVASEADAITDNAFVAVMTEITSLPTETTEDGVTYVNYILNKVNGVTDFYKANGKKVGANKAYLRIDKATASKGISIGYADETDGIRTIGNEPQKVDGIYNLSGQRVNKAQKGIYIVNGKKVVVK